MKVSSVLNSKIFLAPLGKTQQSINSFIVDNQNGSNIKIAPGLSKKKLKTKLSKL